MENVAIPFSILLILLKRKGEKMRTSVLRDEKKKPYGIRVTAVKETEKALLRRFYEGGVKVNSITGDMRELHLTFQDLVGT